MLIIISSSPTIFETFHSIKFTILLWQPLLSKPNLVLSYTNMATYSQSDDMGVPIEFGPTLASNRCIFGLVGYNDNINSYKYFLFDHDNVRITGKLNVIVLVNNFIYCLAQCPSYSFV